MAGKTLKHISYFKYFGSKILDSRESQVCKVLAWSVCNKLAPFVAQTYFSAVELGLLYISKKLNNKCLAVGGTGEESGGSRGGGDPRI